LRGQFRQRENCKHA